MATVPHENVEDLVLIFRMDLHSESGMMAFTRVNQTILDAFGVSAEQMKKDVLENVPLTHLATLRSMEEVLSDMMGGFTVPGPALGQSILYVASTETVNHGAGVLVYPRFLEEASEKIGGNFFVLPSSIHDLLFMKDNEDISRHELQAMVVRSVNAAEVQPEDQLSNNVYHYDGQARVFEMVEKYDARKTGR